MTEAVEVAIELGLMDRAQTFAANNSMEISLPNIKFTKPSVSVNAKYLRATLLPADTANLGVGFSSTKQHLGLLQIDVFYGTGGGEIEPKRIASRVIDYFARGTRIVNNGFTIEVLQTPRLGPLARDDAWMFIPVRIPYNCFATPA